MGQVYLFSAYLIFEFDKNANSAKLDMLGMSLVLFQLVWRQLEFAFLVRQLRLAHFLFLKERKNEILSRMWNKTYERKSQILF